MIDLTVDTNVIMIGCGMSSTGDRPACRTITSRLIQERDTYLVLDDGGNIRQEYEEKMGATSPGRYWLRQMLDRDRVRTVVLRQMDRGTKAKLDEAHFHWGDVTFVRTARETISKRLVSEDHGVNETRIRKILKKRLEVIVAMAGETCASLGWR